MAVAYNNGQRLGNRLGLTIHQSPLRHKIQRLMAEFPSAESLTEEDWLVDLANARGLRVVFRINPKSQSAKFPGLDILGDEELIAALCQLQCRDKPQILRLAAQRISRGGVNQPTLVRLAVMERIVPILSELCRQALKVDTQHLRWRELQEALPPAKALREPITHWTRLAEPVMRPGQPNATGWKLVS